MKFLALGLLMFLQAGTADKMQQSEQQWMQQDWHHNGNSVTYDPSTGKIYQSGKEWIPVSGGAPPQEQDKEIRWVGSSTKQEILLVSGDWDCKSFNDDARDPTIVGVVCTKPKQK
jgi:hypothetical protein